MAVVVWCVIRLLLTMENIMLALTFLTKKEFFYFYTAVCLNAEEMLSIPNFQFGEVLQKKSQVFGWSRGVDNVL